MPCLQHIVVLFIIIFPFSGYCCSLFRLRQQNTLIGSGKDGLGKTQTVSQS